MTIKKVFLISVLSVFYLTSCEKDPVSANDRLNDSDSFNYTSNLTRGISRTELPWLSGGIAAQTTLLDSIKAAGCEVIRLSLSRDALRDEVMTHILYCNKIGIDVLVILKTTGIKELYPDGTELRDGGDNFWDVYCHSDLDTARYDSWINELLEYWHSNDCVIDAIEVGNEIAWADFNGDFPIMNEGEGYAFDDSNEWSSLPYKVQLGLEKVGVLLKHTKTAVQKIWTTDNAPKVILGGLNWYTDMSWMTNVGGTIMKPDYVLKILKGQTEGQTNKTNYLEYLDAIALHFYPNNSYNENFDSMVNDSEKYIEEFMGDITSYTNLPVYITEMGYRISVNGIEHDNKRAEMFLAFFKAMENNGTYNWGPVYIYSWDQGEHRLTENGEALYCARHIF